MRADRRKLLAINKVKRSGRDLSAVERLHRFLRRGVAIAACFHAERPREIVAARMLRPVPSVILMKSVFRWL